MTVDHQSLATESWAFVLKLYAKPGVSEACLRLQTQANVDVVLLLVAVFAVSQRQLRLSATDIRSMDNVSRPWREQVVHPLRTLRTELKSWLALAPSEATERLRSQIKASELAAERLENNLLATWLQLESRDQAGLKHAGPTRVDLHNVIQTVVRHTLSNETGRRVDDMLPAIDVIAEAVDKIAI